MSVRLHIRSARAAGSSSVSIAVDKDRVSTQKNQLLQNQLFGDLVCTPTYKNLLVQISLSKTSSILQKTALNSDRNQLLTSHSSSY